MAVVCHEDEILVTAPTEALAIHARFERDDVSGDEVSPLGPTTGGSWISMPTPCPSEWKKPFVSVDPGFFVRSVGYPASATIASAS
jgi:hypothetical protein